MTVFITWSVEGMLSARVTAISQLRRPRNCARYAASACIVENAVCACGD